MTSSRKVLDIVAGNEQVQTVGKLDLGTGVLGENLILFYKMDLGFQVFQGDCVPEIAIKAVGLFHQHAAAVRAPQELHHLAEALTARRFRGFHVHEFPHDAKLMT